MVTTGYEGIKFDAETYFKEIIKIKESLKGLEVCVSSTATYNNLKSRFASKSEPKPESELKSIASS